MSVARDDVKQKATRNNHQRRVLMKNSAARLMHVKL